MLRALTLSLLFAATLAHADLIDPEAKLWKRAGFLNAEFSSISVPVAISAEAIAGVPVTYALDATIVMFRHSGWTKEVMERHLKRTNEIYAQCGIRMGEIKFVESDAYRGKLDILSRWSIEGDDYAISKATPTAKRPVIYLMRDIVTNGNRDGAFTNISKFFVPLEPITQNTIWISSVINTPEYSTYRDMEVDGKSVLKTRDESYNVVAHEIAHLLADMGHETDLKEKNLLNGSNEILGEHLLPRQCEKFKLSPLLRKISP